MQITSKVIMTTILSFTLLSGCASAFLEVKAGSEKVAVVDAKQVSGCESKGTVTSSVLSKVWFVNRGEEGVEEAEKVSADSWDILIPTIRNEGSEIWVSFNPEDEKSSTYQRFVINPPPDCARAELNYLDNKYFPEVLRKEMEYCKRVDFDKYEHVWLGKCKRYSEALIIPPRRLRIEDFETPAGVQFYFGMDFGFSNDPACVVRMFIKDNRLWIDEEAYGTGIEIEELEPFMDSVHEIRKWPVFADSQRPDTISFLARKGFDIKGAEKGKGSVEDGIQFLRGFEEIVIHSRCKGAIDNFTNYKWKTDRITGEVLPIPAEGSDHIPDACRYGLEKYIKRKVTIFDILGG